MPVRGVIDHEIQQDADIPLPGVGLQPVEIRHGAVLRIDVLVVGNIVTEVHLRRRKEGSDPDAVDSQILQIVEMDGDAVEIADAVAIGVPEAARVDLVDDGVMPPGLGIRNHGPLGESEPAEQRGAREKTQNQSHEGPFERKYPLCRGSTLRISIPCGSPSSPGGSGAGPVGDAHAGAWMAVAVKACPPSRPTEPSTAEPRWSSSTAVTIMGGALSNIPGRPSVSNSES